MAVCSWVPDTPYFKNNRVPEISDIWIYQENSGQGMATSLITYLEQIAKEKGYETS